MFERYTEKARRVIFFARYEARVILALPALKPSISSWDFLERTMRSETASCLPSIRSNISTKGSVPSLQCAIRFRPRSIYP